MITGTTAVGLGDRGYYLGSPGRMLELPQPSKGTSPSGLRFSALSRSLNGTGTEWLFGTKRKYELELPYCTALDRRWLELCWDGAVQPLWFIDPLTANRFGKGVASTGSTLRGEREFVSDGPVAAVAMQPDFPEAPPRSARATNATYLGATDVPCVEGETLTFVAWCYGDGTLTPSVTFTDVTGGTTGTVNGTAVPAGSVFSKVVLLAQVPSRSAFAAFRLTQPAAGGITTSAWRVASDGGTDWTHGGGAYRVAMTDKSSSSDRFPLETVSITIEEL